MADIEQHHDRAWAAAAIASETSKEAALDIVRRMELNEAHCDSSDWVAFCHAFGGLQQALNAIYASDNQNA